MSRPSKLTSEATDRYVRAIGAGAFPEVAARFAGFSPASLYRYLRGSTPEHAAFRDAALKAQVDLEVRLSGTLVQEAMSEPKWALVRLPSLAARRAAPLAGHQRSDPRLHDRAGEERSDRRRPGPQAQASRKPVGRAQRRRRVAPVRQGLAGGDERVRLDRWAPRRLGRPRRHGHGNVVRRARDPALPHQSRS